MAEVVLSTFNDAHKMTSIPTAPLIKVPTAKMTLEEPAFVLKTKKRDVKALTKVNKKERLWGAAVEKCVHELDDQLVKRPNIDINVSFDKIVAPKIDIDFTQMMQSSQDRSGRLSMVYKKSEPLSINVDFSDLST